MEDKQYIVALEIASSHIAGVVASIDAAGARDASVVCYHEEPIADCVRYGSIVNVDEVCNKVSLLLKRIEADRRVAPRKIKSVYIALSGRSLHTKVVEIERELDEGTPISKEFIRQIDREAADGLDKSEVLDVVPRSFEIDGAAVANPVGSLGMHLHASMNVVMCRPQTRRNILMVFDKLQIEVNDFIISPLAAAQSLLTEEERRLGCVLVDHGAETTAVAIYKNDRLMYLNVLPMGSRNITRDLVSLNILEESAEKIKCNYGDAMSAGSDLQKLDIAGVGSLDVANYVTARAGEIMENVYNQLSIAELSPEQLPAGIVAIGRGMRLKRMPDLLRSISKMPVRIGLISGIEESMALADVPQLLSAVNEISARKEIDGCLTVPEMPHFQDSQEKDYAETEREEAKRKEKKETKRSWFGGFIDKINAGINGTFDDDEDDDNNKKY